MTYLIKFDENGRRSETYVAEEKTIEQVQELLDKGFEVVEEDIYQILLGNIDGNEHIKNLQTGKFEVYVPPVYVPTEAEIQAQLTAAVQAYMDSTTQTRGYDNIHTACSYATSTDHIFAAEGIACVKWRDAVWRKYFDVLAEVDEGTREYPTPEELIAELPVLEW